MKKADIIIAAAVLLLSAMGYFLTGAVLAGETKRVVIECDGEVFAEYPMTEKRTVDVNGHNTVEITPDYVRVIYADCPDKIDVKQGEITSPGSVIVCMPNKMTVRIAGEAEVDAISY